MIFSYFSFKNQLQFVSNKDEGRVIHCPLDQTPRLRHPRIEPCIIVMSYWHKLRVFLFDFTLQFQILSLWSCEFYVRNARRLVSSSSVFWQFVGIILTFLPAFVAVLSCSIRKRDFCFVKRTVNKIFILNSSVACSVNISEYFWQDVSNTVYSHGHSSAFEKIGHMFPASCCRYARLFCV